MSLFIVSTETLKHGGKPVTALFTHKEAVFLHRRNTETLHWIRTRFKPLPTDARLDRLIDTETPGELMFLVDFMSNSTTDCTFFGLTLDTSPTDIFKAALVQTAFYYYFHASRHFDIDSRSTLAVAGSLFRLDSMCRILANVFCSTVIRLDPERERSVIDTTISVSRISKKTVSVELNSSAENTDTVFEPVHDSTDHFRKAYSRYLKAWDTVSIHVNSTKQG
jgi:sugar (pentulose or hexulose) kinase